MTHIAPFNSHTNNKLLQFDDIIKVDKRKLVFAFNNNILPIELLYRFKLKSDINSHNVSKGGGGGGGGIFIPKIQPTNF